MTLGYSLFATRWLQAPLYFGLVAAQGVYVYKFFRELWTLIVRSVTGQANETYVHESHTAQDALDVHDPSEPGVEARIRDARFPARKLLEEFDEEYPRVLDREAVARLGGLDFVTARRNVVFVGPPGTGKTHLAVGLGVRACQSGHQVLFATAAQWAARLAGARSAGRLSEELADLDARPLLIVDEVGYTPLDPDTAHLFFQLVAHRYERSSLIVTTDRPLSRWEEVFGGAAPAMVDRLAHHAEIVRLEGDSYRTRRVTASWTE
ncbi:IS21-like element helper ATPase IstB [Streptomyces sp. NPDC102365]|uniref:IS21-like element helper ATPase IstB n=1 Tax=Streptomyces sp. NPDC102365 TaxID=3366162 RepID=UPI0038141E51